MQRAGAGPARALYITFAGADRVAAAKRKPWGLWYTFGTSGPMPGAACDRPGQPHPAAPALPAQPPRSIRSGPHRGRDHAPM
ncbi:hypothetical protein CBM2637_A170077 [Cupriavidus taiwanensis]|nr:hypothetical protein CBM2637_A170077 [Cupriavidus taiwanensis]